MEKIVFFFPWKELSGGPFYLADIAQDLAKDVNYDVYYVDYPDGIAAKYLKCPKVKIVPYGFHESFLNNNRCVLVTPIYCAGHVPVLQDESRILFLNWHNYCITSLINTWKIKRDLQQFLFMVYRTQSVFFLDAAHRAAQNEYVYPKGAYEFNEEYVPIVIKTDIQSKNRRSIVHKTLNLAVLGRLTVDKAFSVLNLLRCLEDSVICTPVKIYIIGDGEAKGILDNYLSTSSLDVEFDFMAVSSYEGTESTGNVLVKKDISNDITGKDIIIVEDILDTGKTLHTVRAMLMEKGAASVEIATLLNKQERRVYPIQAKYVGFEIPNAFVIGYGMDYNENYRNLPYVGVLKEEVYS